LAASDSFFRRIVADNSINHFFAGTDLAHLLAHYKMFSSALLGGPEPYTGQDIGAAHAHLCLQLNDSLRCIPETFPRGAAGSRCQG
jgi:hemoglobin